MSSNKFKLRDLVLALLQEKKEWSFTVSEIVASLGREKCGANPYVNVKSNLTSLVSSGKVTVKKLEKKPNAAIPINVYSLRFVPIDVPARKFPTVYDIPVIAPPPYRPHPSERYHPDWSVARGGAMQHARCPSVGTP